MNTEKPSESFSRQVSEIWNRKVSPERMTHWEHEKAYRLHYTYIDEADESSLLALIERYANHGVLHYHWFVLLLSQYPSDTNFDKMINAYAEEPRFHRVILLSLITHPKISCAALRLILRRIWTVPFKRGTKRKRNYLSRIAKQKLVQRQYESWAYEI